MALLFLALGGLLAASVAVTGTAQQAEAAITEKVVFTSDRTTGQGVNNPQGDYEIFKMNPDGTGKKNLTHNGVEVAGAYPVDDYGPDFSPTGKKIVYRSNGKQTSNPEGDSEVYRMNALDGTGQKNLTDNAGDVFDGIYPD